MDAGEAASLVQGNRALGQTYSGDGTDARTSDLRPAETETQQALDALPVSPSAIKQETVITPQPSSPLADHTGDVHVPKAVAALKGEPSMRLGSPLRESSVPVLSTEPDTSEGLNSKKRPAPTRSKKGTATAAKGPAAKKRKVEQGRSSTPSSVRASKHTVLKQGSIKGTPATSSPSSSRARSNSLEPQDDSGDDDEDFEGEIDDDNLYCICRKPDTGTFMIGCDGTCDDWFHGKCVGIEERNKNLIDKYMCPRCTQAGIGVTLWKRVCRRGGCRQPARTAQAKGASSASKYCSQECGVGYFRSLAKRCRNSGEPSKSRSTRSGAEPVSLHVSDTDLGARGGLLSKLEVKCLLQSSPSLDEFQSLGHGVLSPPVTPKEDGTEVPYNDLAASTSSTEELAALEEIGRLKEKARARHQLLKDRMKFITLAKQAANRVAAEKELKPKEYCGYDARIEWPDEHFLAWRNSDDGKTAFDQEVLNVPSASQGAETDSAEADKSPMLVCARKKCARHLEWGKLAVDDVRFEMADNSDKMRGYDRDEQDVRRRAALRLNTGTDIDAGHSVEMHKPNGHEQVPAAA